MNARCSTLLPVARRVVGINDFPIDVGDGCVHGRNKRKGV